MSDLPNWMRDAPAPHSAMVRLGAEKRQGMLTKPLGSLGRLEDLAILLAAIQGREDPAADRVAIILFAGDHGVTAEGVSAFPNVVTTQMMTNFANGGAAVSVLARALDAPLMVVDAGSLNDGEIAGVIVDKPRSGTANFAVEPAMLPADAIFAMEAGRRAVERADAFDVVVFGEMGIGNTTSAAAIGAALTGATGQDMAGAGTGLDAPGVARKAEVIDHALALHDLNRLSAADHVLTCVGGLEIAALTGAIVRAAQLKAAVLIDGFIVSAAALAACRINPGIRDNLIFAHQSAEHGHDRILAQLSAEPLLDLGMRLGEGSGACVAVSVLRHACALHNDMATFAEAAVSEQSET